MVDSVYSTLVQVEIEVMGINHDFPPALQLYVTFLDYYNIVGHKRKRSTLRNIINAKTGVVSSHMLMNRWYCVYGTASIDSLRIVM